LLGGLAPIRFCCAQWCVSIHFNLTGVNMAYKIQHLGLGGILDQAIAITKNHFGLLISIMLLLLVPFNLIPSLILESFVPAPPLQPTEEESRQYLAALLQYLPFVIILWLLMFLVALPLTNAALIHAIARLYLGQSITAIEALRHALRRLMPLIGTTILMYIPIFLGSMACFLPGLLFAVWFGLSQHVVVIEGISGPAALGRSKKLAGPHWATFLSLYLILFVMTGMIQMAAAFIPQPYVKLAVATLIYAVTGTLWAAAFVVFYFSCRCAEENFDLHYLAEAIGSEAAAADDQIAAHP
jgi:hypothetical protein